ncbi:MAG: hypothetical protein JWM16_6381 [Verrucomicrobiales bacterium]|nr:hypothetical protein [Verrucomicrobiales bacterium]
MTINTDASDILAKYAPIARCERRTFTKIKRGPRAVQWCSWCQKMLKPGVACPVAEIVANTVEPTL